MGSYKEKEVALTDLKTNFHVRKNINDEWALQLAVLYEAGEIKDPIEINLDNEIIDGRHRKRALEILGRKTAICHCIGQKGPGESLIEAMKANVGGSLPPTKADIVHTMILLLNQGWTERKIVEQMPFPKDVTRKYLKDAWGTFLDRKLRNAVSAVADEGLTAKEAAERFKVPLEKLKTHMNPNRRKREAQGIKHRQQRISRKFAGFTNSITREIKQAFLVFEDQEMSEDEIYYLLDSINDLYTGSVKRLDEHRERFMATAREYKKSGNVDHPELEKVTARLQ